MLITSFEILNHRLILFELQRELFCSLGLWSLTTNFILSEICGLSYMCHIYHSQGGTFENHVSIFGKDKVEKKMPFCIVSSKSLWWMKMEKMQPFAFYQPHLCDGWKYMEMDEEEDIYIASSTSLWHMDTKAEKKAFYIATRLYLCENRKNLPKSSSLNGQWRTMELKTFLDLVLLVSRDKGALASSRCTSIYLICIVWCLFLWQRECKIAYHVLSYIIPAKG